jgi:glutamine phosphoribosylpyrophosphate amidotransferase
MCGIFGYIGSQSDDAIRAELENMARLIRHRGPDQQGFQRHDTKFERLRENCVTLFYLMIYAEAHFISFTEIGDFLNGTTVNYNFSLS